jgi:hypothetical protein
MRADGRPETLSPDDQRAKGGSSDCRLHETQRTLITVTCAKEGGGERDRRRIPPQCGSATIWNMPRRPQPAEKKAAEDRFFSVESEDRRGGVGAGAKNREPSAASRGPTDGRGGRRSKGRGGAERQAVLEFCTPPV